MAVAAATLLAVVFIMLPTGSGPRPEPRLLTSGDPQSSTSFTIHDAAPPTPVTLSPATPPATQAAPTTPPAPGDLDALMQRPARQCCQRCHPPPTTPPAPDATVNATTTAPAAPVVPAPAPAPTDATAVPPPEPAAAALGECHGPGHAVAAGPVQQWVYRLDRSRWRPGGGRPRAAGFCQPGPGGGERAGRTTCAIPSCRISPTNPAHTASPGMGRCPMER